jgi:hypothetical protein
MSDEKWWFGLIARTFAKMCPELGIEKNLSRHITSPTSIRYIPSPHTSHVISSDLSSITISLKVMGHATVGYLFYDTPENGGKACLIGFHRCQNFKVAQRTTNETKRDPVTGKITRRVTLSSINWGIWFWWTATLKEVTMAHPQTQSLRCGRCGST